jgi:hypothetical protein
VAARFGTRPWRRSRSATRHDRAEPSATVAATPKDAALDRAAVTFAGRTPDAVAHASTTSGYVIRLRQLGTAYFRRQGFAAVVTRAAGLPATRPVRTRSASSTGSDTTSTTNPRRSFSPRPGPAPQPLLRTGLRTGRLVLAANQALLWGPGGDGRGLGRYWLRAAASGEALTSWPIGQAPAHRRGRRGALAPAVERSACGTYGGAR